MGDYTDNQIPGHRNMKAIGISVDAEGTRNAFWNGFHLILKGFLTTVSAIFSCSRADGIVSEQGRRYSFGAGSATFVRSRVGRTLLEQERRHSLGVGSTAADVALISK